MCTEQGTRAATESGGGGCCAVFAKQQGLGAVSGPLPGCLRIVIYVHVSRSGVCVTANKWGGLECGGVQIALSLEPRYADLGGPRLK